MILYALKAGVFENYSGTVFEPLLRRAISNLLSRDQYKKREEGAKPEDSGTSTCRFRSDPHGEVLNYNSVQSESLGVYLRTQVFETFQSTSNYNVCQCSLVICHQCTPYDLYLKEASFVNRDSVT